MTPWFSITEPVKRATLIATEIIEYLESEKAIKRDPQKAEVIPIVGLSLAAAAKAIHIGRFTKATDKAAKASFNIPAHKVNSFFCSKFPCSCILFFWVLIGSLEIIYGWRSTADID